VKREGLARRVSWAATGQPAKFVKVIWNTLRPSGGKE
jgi:hypothetical protein